MSEYKTIKRVDFGENYLTLEHVTNIHYSSFLPANVYEVIYLSADTGEPNSYNANNTETYLESELELAEKAFEERSKQEDPWRASSHQRPLEDFLTRDPKASKWRW